MTSWHNHAGNQRCRPRGKLAPRSLDELVELVRRAEREKTTVRAVAGHSWSDVASPTATSPSPGTWAAYSTSTTGH